MPVARSGTFGALAVGLLLVAAPLAAQEPFEPFARAFYLEQYEHDLPAAIAAYEEAAASEALSEALRAEAKERIARLREDIAASDLARLAPPEAIAYAELSDPGRHIARLADMLGLLPNDDRPEMPGAPTRLGPGVHFPADFHISPALMDSLSQVRGAAVAVTGIAPRGEPEYLAIIHPGNAQLLRGILETAVQVLEPSEAIEEMPTYRIPEAPQAIWVAVTERLLLISPSRDQIAAALARLKSPEQEGLLSQPEFRQIADDRENALAFAYVDGQRMREAIAKLQGPEPREFAALVDPEHLDSLTAVLRTTEDDVQLRIRLMLEQGHRNLVYSLLRTAPLTRQTLEYVPQGVALVGLLGLNPALDQVENQESPSDEIRHYVAAMDLGRELFCNIQELAVFVAPGDQPGLPQVGLVLAVRDPRQSEALWGQLLALPALFAPQVPPPVEVTLGGHEGKEFRLPDAPPIQLVRTDNVIVVGTPGAAAAAAEAGGNGVAVTEDRQFAELLELLRPESSKAILVHVGRALEVASSMERGRGAEEMRRMAELLEGMTAALVTHEAPTEFAIQAAVSGLPNVPRIVRMMAAPDGHGHPAVSATHRPHPAEVIPPSPPEPAAVTTTTP